MALRAQFASYSVLQHLRSRVVIPARCAAALRDWNFHASLSQRCFSSDRLQPSKWSLSNHFGEKFSNAVSQSMICSSCEGKLPFEESLRLQKLWCSYYTGRRNSLQTSLSRRYFSCSSAKHTEAVTRAGVIDRPDYGNPSEQPELGNGPRNSEKNVKGTTNGSRDSQRLSSLYVPRVARERYASILTPHLNFDKALTDVEGLANQLQKRTGYAAFTVDKLNALKDGWKQFTILKSEFDEMEEKEFELTKQRKIFLEKLKSAGSELKGKDKELFDRLGIDLITFRKQMKAMTPQLNDLEETLIPELLRLPNTIDKTTPLLADKVLFSLHDPPEFDFPAKSHTELGGLNQTLELSDVAPGAFYLLGDLAEAELALQDLLKDQLGTHFRYLQHANPDFGKGVTVEGCGYDIHNPSEVLRLMARSADDDSKEFLTGGSSLTSFAGYFAKKAVTKTKKFLPQKLFSIGRTYTPRRTMGAQETYTPVSMPQDSMTRSQDHKRQKGHETNYSPAIDSTNYEHHRGESEGIFSSMQSTSISAFVADTKESNSEEDVVNELLAVSTAVYSKLGLHFRIVQRNAKTLKPFEKAVYSIELTTTSFQSLENSSSDSQSSPNRSISPSESVRDLENHPRRSKNGCSAPTYVEIGRISLIGDYVSKRLLMLYDKRDVLGGAPNQRGGSTTRYGFLNVVFAEVMNVSKFLAVMMENTQTKDGGYEIPAVLHKYPVMTGSGGIGKEK